MNLFKTYARLIFVVGFSYLVNASWLLHRGQCSIFMFQCLPSDLNVKRHAKNFKDFPMVMGLLMKKPRNNILSSLS